MECNSVHMQLSHVVVIIITVYLTTRILYATVFKIVLLDLGMLERRSVGC